MPICKFQFDGVSIDLIYAQSSTNALNNSFDIHSDEVVRAVTPQTIRSLNGFSFFLFWHSLIKHYSLDTFSSVGYKKAIDFNT